MAQVQQAQAQQTTAVIPSSEAKSSGGNAFLEEVVKQTNGSSRFSFVTLWPKCCGTFQMKLFAGANDTPVDGQVDQRVPMLSGDLKAPCCAEPFYVLANASQQQVFKPQWPGACKCCDHPIIQDGQGNKVAQVCGPSCGQKITAKVCPCLGKIYFRAVDASGQDRFTLRKFGCCKSPQTGKCCDFDTDVECEGCDVCCEWFGECTDCLPGVDQVPGLSAVLSIMKTIHCKEIKECIKCVSSNGCQCSQFYRMVPVFSADQANIIPIAKIEFRGFFTCCKNALKPGYQVIITPPANASFNDTAALLLLAIELDRMTVALMVGRNAK